MPELKADERLAGVIDDDLSRTEDWVDADDPRPTASCVFDPPVLQGLNNWRNYFAMLRRHAPSPLQEKIPSQLQLLGYKGALNILGEYARARNRSREERNLRQILDNQRYQSHFCAARPVKRSFSAFLPPTVLPRSWLSLLIAVGLPRATLINDENCYRVFWE
ncbi:hypothetical protein F5I97DRAFT_1401390 [Phlebopus sp. FC_14]|nr:hypothetical protein F5I97DRAFT_1401390 [Phlebopus sp. FC_14]